MAQASIPVDLFNPGQVFACMGFLEAAEVLLGGVEAHFDWSKAQAMFVLRADGGQNPFEVVLEFLSKAKIRELIPIGYVEGGAADGGDDEEEDTTPSEPEDGDGSDDSPGKAQARIATPAFPAGEGDRNALPIQLVHDGRCLTVSHWADGSSRDAFKLYSGNRSAKRIATQMLQGVRAKPKKNHRSAKRIATQMLQGVPAKPTRNQSNDGPRNKGLRQLWEEQKEALLKTPFDVVTPMGGSFNFDPRGAWTAINAGYSPNTQEHGIAASPVVEILAAIGLEHTRPDQYETRKVRYAVWGKALPPMLARAVLAGADLKLPMRRFVFNLDLSGKDKVTTFAQEETRL
jgi:CRISPR-associated protein Csx14